MRLVERARHYLKKARESEDLKKIRHSFEADIIIGNLFPIAHLALAKALEHHLSDLDSSERWWVAGSILAVSTIANNVMNYRMLKAHDLNHDPITTAWHLKFGKKQPAKALGLRFAQSWTIDFFRNPANYALVVQAIQDKVTLPPGVIERAASAVIPEHPASMFAAIGILGTSFTLAGNSYVLWRNKHGATNNPEISESPELTPPTSLIVPHEALDYASFTDVGNDQEV